MIDLDEDQWRHFRENTLPDDQLPWSQERRPLNEEILSLVKIRPLGLSVRDVSIFLNIPEPSARVYLHRLAKNGRLKRLKHGRRVRFIDPDTLPLNSTQYNNIPSLMPSAIASNGEKIHHLHLIFRHKGETRSWFHSPLSIFLTPRAVSADNKQTYELPLGIFLPFWRGPRKAPYKLSKRRAEIVIACSDAPLSFDELRALFSCLESQYGLDVSRWDVRCVDFSVDSERVRLDGLTSVTYQAVPGVLLKAYEKFGGLRTELVVAGKHATPLTQILDLFAARAIQFASDLH